ncbi:MAG: 2-hydroxyacyl-CoA dehydratase [Clostridiales bacterium]|jgi:benzoyl-CoA reductase subunit C|nr:2-hydroxyacyl-CoA dehydratase [Clostridiales bacterium]
MNHQKLFESDISSEAAKEWRSKGKKVLGVICCHVPEEIFYAADVLPIRMRATGCVDSSEAETWMSSFSCSFAKAMLQYWLDGTYELDGFVTSDGCLMAARVFDNAAYINEREKKGQFIRQIGAPRKRSPRTIPFYKAELADLVDELEKFTGSKITDEKLKEAAAKYNEARALVSQLYELRKEKNPVISGADTLRITLAATNMPIDEYIELLKAFLADAKNRTPITDARARIMVIGSALDNPEYLEVIEEKGGIVVADALCFGNRGFGEPLVVDDKDVLGSIADYYLSRLVCPRMMDKHEEMHDFIIKSVREYNVDGVIYQRMQNCEVWGGENVLLEQKLKNQGIPLLTVEREEQMANAGQLAVRAEAFIEMIEKED